MKVTVYNSTGRIVKRSPAREAGERGEERENDRENKKKKNKRKGKWRERKKREIETYKREKKGKGEKYIKRKRERLGGGIMEPDGMNVVMNIYRKQYLDFRYDYISRSEDILQSLCLYFFLFVCPCVQQETPRPLKIERRNKN